MDEPGDNNAEAKYGKLNIPKDDDISKVWSLREFGEEDDGAQQRKHSVSSAGPRAMFTSPSEICEESMDYSFSQGERRVPICQARRTFHMPTRPQAPPTPYDSYRQHSADAAASTTRLSTPGVVPAPLTARDLRTNAPTQARDFSFNGHNLRQ
ncbi:hypothetical protein GCG54_00015307 [Colletotrichum gloeosporioides]|uniref:Uncharacterized protein n=1 Tax=Colletotrichum gloeosporioides TaxID=474922 RepID=A0A8H4C8H9_COLGL|nr:uncharacterized protein GCG54_00015307 [Colletotrichum gloeosporioides]KAF3799126.1 hypothetical protein GCG54_00015307 [Colletotrichum gloeosporioides]